MRTCVVIVGFILVATIGLIPPTMAESFTVGQTITLNAKNPKGVPLHREPNPSYWKHVPDGLKGTVQHIANNGWLQIAFSTGEEAWVHPKYVNAKSSTDTSHIESTQEPAATTESNLHVSSEQEEKRVWASPSDCQQVVQSGGRMALRSSERLRLGTWNIRWFPYGRPPSQSENSEKETDIPWLICTMLWMNLDVLAIEESLETTQAKETWKTVLTTLKERTSDTWRLMLQRCGDPESHKIGYLWNSARVDLMQVRSLREFNVKAQSTGKPCEGGLRPGHYAYVQSKQQPGVDFHLIALHLKSGPTVFALEDRHRALNRIDDTVSQFLAKDQDIVILGDFNTMGAGDESSRKSELKYLRRMVAKEMPGFQDLPLVPQCSHYFRGRGGWLDHVLVNHGMEEFRERSARVTGYCAAAQCQRIKGDYPLAYQRLSDHCPVIIEIANEDKD